MLGQSMLPVEFRDFEREHYRRLVEIYNSIYPGYDRSTSEWQFEDEHLDRTKYHLKRYACANKESDKVLGFGQVMHPPWMFHPRKFFIDIWVDPKHQKQKIGASIYDRLNRDLAEMKAITVWAQAREDMPWSSSFLDKRGFREKMRAWESRLNPSQVNPAKFEAYPRKVSGQGITISTLAEERTRDPEWERKLYELIQTVAGDMPMPEQFTPASFEQWQAWEMKSPNLVPEGYMIAKDGTRYVGASVVWRTQEKPTNLWQGITGVRREYRGRGIAVALKLRIVDYAARSGFDMIRTFNDSTNTPMLGINMKIGFKREIGWITFEKHIA